MNEINRADALRYMGFRDVKAVDERTAALVDECEKKLISAAKPRFVSRVFNIIREGERLFLGENGAELLGNDVKRHLNGCEKAAVVCSTLSADTDKFLKKQELADALEGLISDALASAYAETVSEEALSDLLSKMKGYNATWIFAAGYGDFPAEQLPELLRLVDAERKIGVSCLASGMLSPSKTIAGVAGLSEKPLGKAEKSCAGCKMRDKCEFRRNGERCI